MVIIHTNEILNCSKQIVHTIFLFILPLPWDWKSSCGNKSWGKKTLFDANGRKINVTKEHSHNIFMIKFIGYWANQIFILHAMTYITR